MHHPMTHLWVSILAMVSKSDNDGGLDGLGDRFPKVSNSGCGDVGGVWKKFHWCRCW